MKAKLVLLLLLVGSLVTTNYNGVQAQNTPSDKQAIAMIREFYTAYITGWAKQPPTLDDMRKIEALKKRYCTASLLKKIDAQVRPEADPFIFAQDIDTEWLKTMSVKKDVRKFNSYIVSYLSYPNSKTIIHLTVIKQGDKFKIMAIR